MITNKFIEQMEAQAAYELDVRMMLKQRLQDWLGGGK